MAKQAGVVKITGTVHGLTFYKMEGHYYVRTKSSLNKNRFVHDPAFSGSRKSAERFANGNRMASEVYRKLYHGKKNYQLFCRLKSLAIRLLKEGKKEGEVATFLERELQHLPRSD